MPNPKAINVPQLGFSDVQTVVLHIMINKEEWDYSTVNVTARMEELSVYSYEDNCTAVYGLKTGAFSLKSKSLTATSMR